MPMLEVPNGFTMLVPDGWTARGGKGTYELHSPESTGTANISMYERDESALRQREASELMDRFLGLVKPSEAVQVNVLSEGDDQQRAVARFPSTNDGERWDWVVFVVLWRHRFLMCSCNAESGSAMPDAAETMFATAFCDEVADESRESARRGIKQRWGRRERR